MDRDCTFKQNIKIRTQKEKHFLYFHIYSLFNKQSMNKNNYSDTN